LEKKDGTKEGVWRGARDFKSKSIGEKTGWKGRKFAARITEGRYWIKMPRESCMEKKGTRVKHEKSGEKKKTKRG